MFTDNVISILSFFHDQYKKKWRQQVFHQYFLQRIGNYYWTSNFEQGTFLSAIVHRFLWDNFFFVEYCGFLSPYLFNSDLLTDPRGSLFSVGSLAGNGPFIFRIKRITSTIAQRRLENSQICSMVSENFPSKGRLAETEQSVCWLSKVNRQVSAAIPFYSPPTQILTMKMTDVENTKIRNLVHL